MNEKHIRTDYIWQKKCHAIRLDLGFTNAEVENQERNINNSDRVGPEQYATILHSG